MAKELDGRREILGPDLCSAEYGASWLNPFRGLSARGLSGVKLVILRRPQWPRRGRIPA